MRSSFSDIAELNILPLFSLLLKCFLKILILLTEIEKDRSTSVELQMSET